jgi:hypothetical protein
MPLLLTLNDAAAQMLLLLSLTQKLRPQDFAQRVTPDADADNTEALDANEDEEDAEAVSLLTPETAAEVHVAELLTKRMSLKLLPKCTLLSYCRSACR